MTKLCFITFVRNNAKELEALLQHVRDIVDEIVVVDGMSNDNTREIAESYGARVYVRKPWGYADPDRQYALTKCQNDWVLTLDVDERLNSRLKNELRDIVESIKREGYVAAQVNSFTILRGKPSIKGRISWQTRIYNRHYIVYRGIVHEGPKVLGKTVKLNPYEYYILHLKGDSWLRWFRSVARYAYFERIEIYRFRGYIEGPLVSLRVAPIMGPIVVAVNIARERPYNLVGLYEALLTGLYRVLCTTLMSLRGRRMEKIAKIVQERGLIQLLKLDRDP